MFEECWDIPRRGVNQCLLDIHCGARNETVCLFVNFLELMSYPFNDMNLPCLGRNPMVLFCLSPHVDYGL